VVILTNRAISQAIKISYEASCVSVARAHVAVGGLHNKVHIYSRETMQELAVLAERDFITALRFSHDDKYLAVADNAKNIKCYAVDEAGAGVPRFENVTRDGWQHHAGKITALSWSPDSQHLASVGVDTQCFVYSPSSISNYIHIKSKLLCCLLAF
jgi:WD40 repeat protein